MRARRIRRSATLIAGLALLATVMPFSPPSASAALVGGFNGDKVCDGGFEVEGDTGPGRAALTGPCWHDTGGDTLPLFTEEVDNGGERSLELCGESDCGEAIGNEFVIPYGITDATLSGDLMRTGTDLILNACEVDFENADYAFVVIQVGETGENQAFVLLCETDALGWQHLEQDVTDFLSDFEGQDATLFVGAHTSVGDAGEQFYADNVSLLITAQGQEMKTYSRKATLSLTNHLKASGRISSTDPGVWHECWAEVTVRFDRKKDGEWVRLTKTVTTDPEGFFTVMLPDKQGKYRALVAQSKLDVANRCGRVFSPVRTHEH